MPPYIFAYAHVPMYKRGFSSKGRLRTGGRGGPKIITITVIIIKANKLMGCTPFCFVYFNAS